MPEIVQAREIQVKNARTICRLALILLIISAAFSGLNAQNASPTGNAAVITRGADFANIDALMNAAVARGSIPGLSQGLRHALAGTGQGSDDRGHYL
jgi:NhaP-type Na+/H+ or K+/H+ antiporter